MELTSNSTLVGITGGIGSGKSVVCNVFQTLGVPVYNADLRARQIMNEDENVISEITSLLGKQSYREGNINRDFIAGKVFNNRELLDQLNSIVHPAVGVDFFNWVKSHEHNHPILAKEAALLIESGSYKELDYLIYVFAPDSLRIERVLKRDQNRSIDEIKGIIEKQLTEDKFRSYADFEIDNSGSSSLIVQVLNLLPKLKSKKAE